MRDYRNIIKNLTLFLLFLIPITMIFIESQGITLMNNMCIYTYIVLYFTIALIYVKLRKDRNILQFVLILVTIYSIAILYTHVGNYETNKFEKNNTIIVQHSDTSFLSGDPDETDTKFYKKICIFFKKDLNGPVLMGHYQIHLEDDYLVITGDAAESFIKEYENSEENSYLKNKLKIKNFKINSFNSLKIYLNI